jgi:Flp pilus assembly protein TadD
MSLFRYTRVYTCSQRSLGRSALARKDFAAAAAAYDRALSRNPVHADVWFSLGFCRLRLSQYDGATAAFTRAVQLDAENGEAWNNLGVLHLRAERSAPAATALGVALKLKGENWQVRLRSACVVVSAVMLQRLGPVLCDQRGVRCRLCGCLSVSLRVHVCAC